MRKNLTIRGGETFSITFPSLGRDLSGLTILLEIRDNVKFLSGSVFYEAFLSGGSEGDISLVIPPEVTSDFKFKLAAYDILVAENGCFTRPFWGDVELIRSPIA